MAATHAQDIKSFKTDNIPQQYNLNKTPVKYYKRQDTRLEQ